MALNRQDSLYTRNDLAQHGYHPCKYSVGLWRHTTQPTKFCLCVDDFRVKYFSKADATRRIETDGKETQDEDDQGLRGQEDLAIHRGSDANSQQKSDDTSDLIL